MEGIMKKTLLLIFVLFMIFCACGQKGKKETSPEYPVIIESVDGVKTVKNPSFPKDGVVKYKCIEEFSIGEGDEYTEVVLNRPIHLQLDSQGFIYVMDWGDTNIKVFDQSGKQVRTVGKKGQGPGEFDTPAYFKIGKNDRIVLLDGRQHRISILNTDGSYVSGFRIEGFCYEIDTDADNRIYLGELGLPEVKVFNTFQLIERDKTIFRYDENGENRFDFGKHKAEKVLRKVTQTSRGTSSISSQSREAYTTVWMISPDQRLFMGYNQDYMISVYDLDYNLLFKFGREFAKIKHPHYAPDRAHPEYYPAFYSRYFFFDDEGNLWLRQYVEEGIEDSIYDVFSPEGIYLKQVHAPHPIFELWKGKAYTIIRTEEDFLVLKCFQLVELEEEDNAF
jgi:hypothetical protein